MTLRQIGFTALLSTLLISSCKAQDKTIIEIPFTLDKRLLVFKGQLNGIETNFAFDTGAAEGIATSNEENNKGVERKKSTQRIIDGNGKIATLQSVVTKELSIGEFKFKNVRATITDMQYLQCMNLYLLGADVIRQLNWEIDFEKMILKVSKNSFETSTDMAIMPLKYEYNTTKTTLKINALDYKSFLIDFGYTGFMEIPTEEDNIKQFIDDKKSKKAVSTSLSSTFAAAGLSKPTVTQKIIVDSVIANGKSYYNIPAEFRNNVSYKIGLGFFSSTCRKVIINNNEKKIYLLLKNAYDFKSSFPIAVTLKNGKLIIAATSLSDNFIANTFTINEEVSAVNGKSATDFNNECEFINWYYLNKWDKLIIKKMDGQEIEVKKIPN